VGSSARRLPLDRATVLMPADDTLTVAAPEPALTPGDEALRLRARAAPITLSPDGDGRSRRCFTTPSTRRSS
jgi:hypothetical protein